MEANKTKELLKKWHSEYPTACDILMKSIEAIDEQLENTSIPSDMIAEFHLAIGQDIIAHMQSDTNEGNLEAIRFDQLNSLMEFNWCGKRYVKFKNDFSGLKPNCKCIDTDTYHKFKPDDSCLIPTKFVKHQNSVSC